MVFKEIVGVILVMCIFILLLAGLNYMVGDNNTQIEEPRKYKIVDIETYYTNGFLYTNKQIKITYLNENTTNYVVASPSSIEFIDTLNESKLVIIEDNYFPQYEIYVKV